jgi:phosphatidylglycerol:prolipoprotein diacylglycerol transferase
LARDLEGGMHPILFKIFGFEVHSFGFMVALGFLAGYFWMRYSAEKTGENPDRIADLSLWVLLSGIIGARLLFVLVHLDQYRNKPLEIIMIWKGGLVLYGGLLAAIIAGAWIVRKKDMNFLRTADVVMPCTMLGLAIGRWGCLMVGDCYGRIAQDLPWAIRFPDVPGSLMDPGLIGQPLHPTQIYMSLNAIVIFVILTLVLRKRRFEGQVFFLCLILYSITRSIIELFRGDNVERGYLGPLSTSQWISLFVVIFAIWQYIQRHRGASKSAQAGGGA